MLQIFIKTTVAVAVSSAASVALAHHSAAAFNTDVETNITGKVATYSFRNPHVYMTLEVKKEDGSVVTVEVEAGAGSVLSPLGFNRDSVKVGETVTIHGNPAKRNGDKLFLGKELYKADGTYMPLHINSRSVYAETGAVATSIAGTWFSPRTTFFALLGSTNSWPVNDAGKKAMASAASMPTPQKDCQPIGEPALMVYPVANQIEMFADRVEMHVDWLDSERVIWLDGRAHPPASDTFLHGHSVGKFEGTTLVVDSTNFAANPIGLSMSLPSSTGKHLVERFELGADGKSLVYSGTVEDTGFLTAPAKWSGTWQYRPEMKLSNEKCDLEAAQKFLDD
jgi:Family of unknown function (DUF6152)